MAVDDLEQSTPMKVAGKKRRRAATPTMAKEATLDLDLADTGCTALPSEKKVKLSPSKPAPQEKRLRRFRKKAPASFLEKLQRATTQRLFVIERKRNLDILEENIDMVGTTGNIYNVKIGLVPTCSCPDNVKGNQCKHIVYVLHNVLKAPEDLQYQLAFLSDELREIFAAAPLPASERASGVAGEAADSNRKAIEGDCPICFLDFSPDTEEIVYCKAACGNNIHQSCFEQWAKSQRGNEVRCVYCRTPWQGDEEAIKRIVKDKGAINEEGYVNVAGELGLSGARDYSSYHPYWRRQQFGYW